MSTNADLASWGESPATPAERALAALLDKVMTQLEQGRVVQPQSLKPGPPELEERGRQLIQAVSWLVACGASVWESSLMAHQASAWGPDSGLAVPGGTQARAGEQMEEKNEALVPGTSEVPDPFPGEFRLRRFLGQGAFGQVWLADDLNLGWQVALKTLRLPGTSTLGPHALAGLRQEAQHLARLHHPNIVQVHAWRQAAGEHYLVLEYVPGGSLADRLKRDGPLDWQQAVRYIADVGEGLLQVHAQGIIHRDIKPANILWNSEKDEALLTDFGVAARLAEPGTVAGTPLYMAPEAFAGQVTPALDVYSLAASLFHLTTGEVPFGPAPLPGLVLQISDGLPVADPRCQCLPEPVERIVRAGLASKPELRPSMPDFLAALRGCLNQLLADAIPAPEEASGKGPVGIHLVISRLEQGRYRPVAATQRVVGSLTRDMRKVPRAPEQITLRTGDQVRIEVLADHDGFLTVFNVGPTGNLNLLYPDDLPGDSTTTIQRNMSLHIVDIEMMPPAGRERLFAIWTRRPLPLRLNQLHSLVDRSERVGSQRYRASRDMARVKQSVKELPREDWHAVVVEVEHTS
jgi:serine/threonine protein kinase